MYSFNSFKNNCAINCAPLQLGYGTLACECKGLY